MNFSLLRILNERYLEKLKEKWWTKKLHCSKIEDQQDGISIANIGGVFIVILIGIVMAIFTLIFEYWYFKYHHPSPKVIGVKEYSRANLNVVLPAHQGPSTQTSTLSKPSKPSKPKEVQPSNEPRLRSRATTHIQIGD